MFHSIQKTPYRLLRSAKKKLANLEELETKLKYVFTVLSLLITADRSRIIASVGGDTADIQDASSFLVSPEEKTRLIKKSKLQQQIALLQAQIDREEKVKRKAVVEGRNLDSAFEQVIEPSHELSGTNILDEKFETPVSVCDDVLPIKSVNIKKPKKQDFITFEEYERRVAAGSVTSKQCGATNTPKRAWSSGAQSPASCTVPTTAFAQSKPTARFAKPSSNNNRLIKSQSEQSGVSSSGFSLAAFMPSLLENVSRQPARQLPAQRKSWATAPEPIAAPSKCSLKDIQQQEEIEKQQSTLKELKGNTVPWLMDRRSTRAGSLEDVMRAQEEEKRKQEEENELQAALALIRQEEKQQIRKKQNSKKSKQWKSCEGRRRM